MRKRSKYRQRGKTCNTMQIAASGARVMLDSEVCPVIKSVDEAIDLLRRGQLDEPNWRLLADMLNMSEGLMRNGIGTGIEAYQCIKTATEAMVCLADRMDKTVTARASELEAIRMAAALHEVQIRACSWREYRKAVAWVENRISAATREEREGKVMWGKHKQKALRNDEHSSSDRQS